MFIGAAEDHSRDVDPVKAKTRMDLAALAGFDAVRMTTIWSPGRREITGEDLAVLENAATAAQLDGIRLLVSVYQRDQRSTPLTARARSDFAAYVASLARKVPWIQDFIIGNEPNLNLFWMPQFTAKGGNAAAIAYERLLATSYDALKAVSPEINVIGGAVSPRGQDRPKAARPTHSPVTFIPDLGAAYRQTGRKKPIMDMFAFHPYLIPSKLPPTFTNPRNSTVGISDYDKLMALLVRAFAGTRQPSLTLPIVYDEFGYQSVIPAAKRSAYTNLASPAAKDAISESKQAAQYRQAFAIAQCQPNVAGMLIFHVADEPDARAWQSGVYYADNTPKTSLPAVRSAALRAQEGALVRCGRPKVTSSLAYVAFREPTAEPPTELGVDFACTKICKYSARVLNTDTGEVAATTAGAVAPGEASVVLPADELTPGSYQYAFRAASAGRAGTAVVRYSRPFTIAAPPAPPPPPPPVEPEEPPADGSGGEPPSETETPPAPTPAAGTGQQARVTHLSSLPLLPTLLPTLSASAKR